MRAASFLQFLSAASVLALVTPAAAQIEHGGEPVSAVQRLSGLAPTLTLPGFDAEALRAENALRGKHEPFRWGREIPVDFDLENAGAWQELEQGGRVWRLRIVSPGAYSLHLIFERFELPEGADLFVYDDLRETVRGAYTRHNQHENGQFAVQPIAGEALTLEFFEPAGATSQLRLGTVVHDFVDVLGLLKNGGGGPEGSCETDVNCPVGAPWQDQINATTRVLSGGSLCSGSLINNTAFDGTQYWITADHCGGMNNAIFYFNYERPTCGSGNPPTNTVSGSSLRANSSGLDFRLVEITPAIPAAYNPFYAGWDRTDSAPPNTVTVHHPQGLPKKISFDDDAPGKSGSQWHIFQWDLGVTQPGSSGSPLYTDEGRFIGQLCCGAAACGFPFDDFYGRMANQWSQLAAFLDPLGTGETKIDGFDPMGGGGPDPKAIFSAAPTNGDVPLFVAFTDQSTGTGLSSWFWDFGDGSTSTLQFPGHLYTTVGTYDVSLTVTGANGSDTLTKVDYIVVDGVVFAGCTSRNGTGSNPDIFDCVTDPILGSTWTATIDAGSIGVGGISFLFGYSAPLPPFPTAFGELLIDPTADFFLLNTGFVAGGSATHTEAIPNDASLEGLVVYTQGFLNQGVLTNAIDLTLGF